MLFFLQERLGMLVREEVLGRHGHSWAETHVIFFAVELSPGNRFTAAGKLWRR